MENKKVSFKKYLAEIKKEKSPLKKTNLPNLQKKTIPSLASYGVQKYGVSEAEKDGIIESKEEKEIPQIDLIKVDKTIIETKIENEVDITKLDDTLIEDINLDSVFSDIIDKYRFEINMVSFLNY